MNKLIKKSPHSAAFKFKVALEAVRGEKTAAELCQTYGVVSSQLFKWKRALLDHGAAPSTKVVDFRRYGILKESCHGRNDDEFN